MDGPKHISFVIRHLCHQMERSIGVNRCDNRDATPYHGRIIGYIFNRKNEDVFQKDIETNFGIRRSTVTKILQLMESNGLIKRTAVISDARLKKITLTDKAIAMHEHFRKEIDRFEAAISEGLTKEETEVFFRAADKIYNNLLELERNDTKK